MNLAYSGINKASSLYLGIDNNLLKMFVYTKIQKGNIMKYVRKSLGILVLCLSAPNINAVTVHKCIDVNNEITYQDKCPPGTESVNNFKLAAGKSVELQPETTLYVVPDCESCDITRDIMKRHGLTNFTEINIKFDKKLQNKLRKSLGTEGALSVPIVIFGEKKIIGFNKEALINELDAAGFKDKTKEESGVDQPSEENPVEESP
jgi:glutaredoxin